LFACSKCRETTRHIPAVQLSLPISGHILQIIEWFWVRNLLPVVSCMCILHLPTIVGVSEQCFTSPPTQYRLYGRRFLQVKRPNQQYQGTEGDATKYKENNENN